MQFNSTPMKPDRQITTIPSIFTMQKVSQAKKHTFSVFDILKEGETGDPTEA